MSVVRPERTGPTFDGSEEWKIEKNRVAVASIRSSKTMSAWSRPISVARELELLLETLMTIAGRFAGIDAWRPVKGAVRVEDAPSVPHVGVVIRSGAAPLTAGTGGISAVVSLGSAVSVDPVVSVDSVESVDPADPVDSVEPVVAALELAPVLAATVVVGAAVVVVAIVVVVVV